MGGFITLEGPEGGGKTTQLKRLAARLSASGAEVICLREPGGTRMGEAIRGLLQHDAGGEPPVPECEVLLFIASRAQLVRSMIRPALERGAWVLCDRFADSTLAYQGYGRGFSVDALRQLNAFAMGDCIPARTFLLDIETKAGMARIAKRQAGDCSAPDRMEREELAFHERVRNGFLELARHEPNRFCVVDAARDEEAVADTIWQEARRVFRLR